MSESIDVVVMMLAVSIDRDTSRDTADVWMRGMHAAVDNGNADAAAREVR